jgi:hypothetical protein
LRNELVAGRCETGILRNELVGAACLGPILRNELGFELSFSSGLRNEPTRAIFLQSNQSGEGFVEGTLMGGLVAQKSDKRFWSTPSGVKQSF